MELFYRKFGQGKPVIILHGLLGSSDNWQSMAKKISADFEVFTPDLRNHGQSPHLDEINYSILAGDVLDFISRHTSGHVYIIGHSLGGKTAMYIALKNPGIVDKLVVVDIAPREYETSHDQYVECMLKLNLADYSRREEIDAVLSEDIRDPTVRQFLMKNINREPQGKFVWKPNLLAIHKHIAGLGTAIQAEVPYSKPTLFLAGGKSDYIKPADTPAIKKLFPNTELIVFENTGHWIHSESPDRFYKEVTRFFNEPG